VPSVDRESRWAEFANGRVFLNIARGAVGTCEIGARIYALVSSAGKVWWTTLVPQADEQGRVAILSADADRLVFDDFAGLALVARIVGARTLARSVNASRVAGTLVVRHALGASRRACDVSRLADHKTRLAHADGPVISDLAPLVHLAGRRIGGARVLTLGNEPVAGQVDRAVEVGDARKIG
jgi:hypothetical protein